MSERRHSNTKQLGLLNQNSFAFKTHALGCPPEKSKNTIIEFIQSQKITKFIKTGVRERMHSNIKQLGLLNQTSFAFKPHAVGCPPEKAKNN